MTPRPTGCFRIVIAIALVFGLQGALLGAQDFWTKKEPSEWTESEAGKMLTKSPWAQQTKPRQLTVGNMPPTMSGPRPRPGTIRPVPYPSSQETMDQIRRGGGLMQPIPCLGWGLGTMALPSPTSDDCKAAWQSVAAAMSTGLPQDSVIVLWESAVPVRDAKTRLAIEDPVNAQATDTFIISIIGYPLLISPTAPSLKTTLRKSAVLIRKGKDEIHVSPLDTTLIQTNEPIIRFFFSRQTIQAGDKAVIFRFQMDTTMVEAKFDLKDMVYRGQLAL